MEPVAEYLKQAREASLSDLERLYPHLFLFKHVKTGGGVADTRPHIEQAVTGPHNFNFDPMPGEARLVRLEKKADNPFPDRLSIGRDSECDVVIRLGFISKVHAHLFVQTGGKLTLRDNNASNGTFINRKKLEAGAACSVKLGDTLSFGGLDFELMDAARLREHARRPPSTRMPTERQRA